MHIRILNIFSESRLLLIHVCTLKKIQFVFVPFERAEMI